MTDNHSTAITAAQREQLVAREEMNPLVKAMLDMGDRLDAAAMREMLALQREWEAGEAKREYTAALVGLHKALPRTIGHDKKVSFDEGKSVAYTHASLAKVFKEVVPILNEHGFTHSFQTNVDRGVVVTCRLTHMGGHSEESSLEAPPDKSGSKSTAQGVVSTVTLLKRHCLLAMLGIATEDMEEPTGEPEGPPADAVNPKRTMAALSWLKRQGIAKADAEAELGKKAEAWTNGDLEDLKTWATATQPSDDEPVDAEFEEVSKSDDWGPNTGPDEDDR